VIGWRGVLALLALLGLAACETPDWLGAPEAPPLPGERISVLRLEAALEPDPGIADLTVKLPRPWTNVGWPQAGGVPSHAMYHLELGDAARKLWAADIGEGSGDEQRLLARPVIADGRIFTMDAVAKVSAFDLATGKQQWSRKLTPEDEEEGAIGGGVSADEGLVFVTTGYGYVYALDQKSGEPAWSRRIGIPFRGAPTVAGGRVFVVTYDNQLYVLATQDGRQLWTHNGLPEEAGLIGSPSVAVSGDIAVVPYTSGELYAMRVENGRVIWNDQLIKSGRLTPLSSLSEIRGSPVIDRGIVFAISHAGRMAAVDMRSGRRLWERDMEGMETPWVAGDFLYIVTTQGEVVCLARRGGRIRWVAQLPRYGNPEKKKDPIHWSGPVLASDRLILAGSNSELIAVSPYTGKILGRMKLSDGVAIPPVVANGRLYILTDGAELIAYE
jgi:outer membrane protein assembly factor BamB